MCAGFLIMVKLGIVLILLSTAVFVAAMVFPDALTPLGPLICKSGERLTTAQSTFSIPGETSTSDSFACEDAKGNQRDVTDTVTGVAIISFMVFLLLGVAMTILGSNRASRKLDTHWTSPVIDSHVNQNSNGSTTWSHGATRDTDAIMNDMRDGLQRGVIRIGGQEVHLDDLKSGAYQINGGGAHTLTETLRQLEDAHTQSLITDDEYQRLRQDALDKLV